MINLTIEDGEGQVLSVPFVRKEISIGRKEGNTIRLTERNISRYHAILTRDGDSVFVEDLDSYNGVVLNGKKIGRKSEVTENDLVQIGDYSLTIEVLRQHVSEKVQLDLSLLEEARRVMSEPSESGETDLATTVSSPEALGVGKDPRKLRRSDEDPKIGSYPTLESIPAAKPEPTSLASPAETPSGTPKQAENAEPESPVNAEPTEAVKTSSTQTPQTEPHVKTEVPVPAEKPSLPPGLDQPGVGGGMRHQDEAFVEQAVRRAAATSDEGETLDEEDDVLPGEKPGMGTGAKVAIVLMLLALLAVGGWWLSRGTNETPTPSEPALVPAPAEEDDEANDEEGNAAEEEKAKLEADLQLMRHLEAQRKEAQERLAQLNQQEQEQLTELIDSNMDKAEKALRKQQWGKAEVALNTILERMPDFEPAVVIRDKVRREKVNEDLFDRGCRELAAKAYLEATMTLASVNEDSYYSTRARQKTKQAKSLAVKRLLRQGIASLQKKDFDAALEKANHVLGIEPDNENGRILKEKAQQRDSRWRAANGANGESERREERREERQEQASPRPASAQTDGDNRTATPEREREQEAPQGPQTADEFFNVGLEQFNAGKFAQAVRSFQQATKKDRNHAASYLALGSSYASLQKPDKALLSYQRFLQLAPNHPQAAQIRQIVEDYKRAMQQQQGQ